MSLYISFSIAGSALKSSRGGDERDVHHADSLPCRVRPCERLHQLHSRQPHAHGRSEDAGTHECRQRKQHA